MASLPSNIGVRYTSPTVGQTLAAFFVGNLFANFLFIVGVAVWITRAFGLTSVSLGILIAYYGFILRSDAHKKGGLAWLRPSVLHSMNACMDYFNTKLIMDGGLKEGQRYIFCCHPHGIHGFGMGVFMNDSESSEFYKANPFLRGKVVGLVAWIMFYIPLVRELFLAIGTRDVSRAVAESTLAEGNSLYLIVGGEAESLRSLPGTDEVVAAGKSREGFVRLALLNNAKLVPVYMFHNTDTYCASRFLYSLRRWISKRYQICLPLWWGRFFTPLPFNIQLTVAVGAPVELGKVEVDADGKLKPECLQAYHQKYLTSLNDLYEKHKTAAGYPPERKLQIVES